MNPILSLLAIITLATSLAACTPSSPDESMSVQAQRDKANPEGAVDPDIQKKYEKKE
jgi:spermidine/putrescine-binding protein